MYLSFLLIDAGLDPDRPRPGRLWLRNLYHVHQRLCMAFPSRERKLDDPHFLKSYNPDDFGQGHVHVERAPDSGFLFRIDPQRGGSVAILVQSALKPDWDYAFHNASYLLAAPPQVKPVDPRFAAGQRLRFRLVANPTRRLSKHSLERDGKPVKETSIGRRVPVPHDHLLDWLADWRLRQDGHDASPGYLIDRDHTAAQPGYVYFGKPGRTGENDTRETAQATSGRRLRRLFSVRYEGTLEVTDPEPFRQTLIHGIGPGKAFGFGLLSIAPCSGPAQPHRT